MKDGLHVRIRALARRIAGRSRGRVDRDDLVQEGMLAMLTATPRFQHGRGASRDTFLWYRVRGAMLDAVRKEMWPRSARTRYRQLQAAREALHAETGNSPSLAEIAGRVGRSEATVRSWVAGFRLLQALSPSDPCPDDRAVLLDLPGHLRPAVPMPPSEYAERRDLYAQVSLAISRLSLREQLILQRYYLEDRSMAEVARSLGLSQSRVSQLHVEAIVMLRVRLHDVRPYELSEC